MLKTKVQWLAALSACVVLSCWNNVATAAPPAKPAKLHWMVFDNTANTQTTTDKSVVLSAKLGASFDVVAIAQDIDGIHEITLTKTVNWRCMNGNLPQPMGPGAGTPQKKDATRNAQGKVLTTLVLGDFAQTQQMVCPAGQTFKDGVIELDGTATNFAGKTFYNTFAVNVNP